MALCAGQRLSQADEIDLLRSGESGGEIVMCPRRRIAGHLHGAQHALGVAGEFLQSFFRIRDTPAERGFVTIAKVAGVESA